MNKWLQDNDIEMHLAHYKRKSERFIERLLKNLLEL